MNHDNNHDAFTDQNFAASLFFIPLTYDFATP